MIKKRDKRPTVDMEELIILLIKVWRDNLHLSGPHDVLQTREFRATCACIKKMFSFLHGSSTESTLQLFEDPGYAAAYLLYFWSIHYQQALSLIGELPARPKKVLDLFSGPGPFAYAASKWGAEEVTCVDSHPFALKLAADVAARSGYPLTLRQAHFPNLSPIKGEQYDLITIGYALKELSSQGVAFSDLFEKILPHLAEDGMILFVDSSFDTTCKKLLSLRDYCQQNAFPIVAPCVWQGKCPALASGNWLCYAQRPLEKPYLIKELQRGADIHQNSLKMSYLLLRHPKKGAISPPENVFRVVSPPLNADPASYWLCGTRGKKLLCGSQIEAQEAKAFSFLKRGELISVEETEEKRGELHIKETTRIKVEAALGKPIATTYLDQK